MMPLNAAALERSSKRRGVDLATNRRAMTPDVLGRIIACAWRIGSSDDIATVLTPAALSQRILEHIKDMPVEMQNILHIDRRVDGDEVEEASQLLVGAQSVGVLGRLNPTHASALVKADALQAHALLDRFEAEYPEIVAWAKKVAADR